MVLFQHLKDSSLIISILKTFLVSEDEASFEDTLKFYPNVTYFDEDGKQKIELMNKYSIMYGNLQDKDKRQ